EVADRGGGGETFGEEIAHAGGAAFAEALVAFRIAFAVVDRADVVPHPQDVPCVAAGDEPVQQVVGLLCGGSGAAVFAFVQLDRGEQPAAAGRPAQRAFHAAAHRRVHLPQFQRRGGIGAGQRHLQVARIVTGGYGRV